MIIVVAGKQLRPFLLVGVTFEKYSLKEETLHLLAFKFNCVYLIGKDNGIRIVVILSEDDF